MTDIDAPGPLGRLAADRDRYRALAEQRGNLTLNPWEITHTPRAAPGPSGRPSRYQVRLDAFTVAARAVAGARVPDDTFFDLAARVEARLADAAETGGGDGPGRVGSP